MVCRHGPPEAAGIASIEAWRNQDASWDCRGYGGGLCTGCWRRRGEKGNVNAILSRDVVRPGLSFEGKTAAARNVDLQPRINQRWGRGKTGRGSWGQA